MARLSEQIQVMGSRGDIYTIKLFEWQGKIKFRCDCQAGKSGQFCKHRRAVLHQDSMGHAEACGDGSAWSDMQKGLDSTGLRKTLLDMDCARERMESDLERIKVEIKKLKIKIGKLCEEGE